MSIISLGRAGRVKVISFASIANNIKKKFKNNEICLFSNLKEDESLDSVKPKRFRLDEEIHNDPIKVEELANSCVIFDDTDCISDRKIKNAVCSILDQCLEVGRHHKITVLITFHLPSDRHTTRKMLNESQYFVYFPQSSSSKIRYVLTNYLDIDERMIKFFKRLNTRWVCIRKNFPMCWVSEHACALLNVDSEDE